ncbi:MAG: hypothetical protein AAF840_10185, partial [Bacteroidota bacterium]
MKSNNKPSAKATRNSFYLLLLLSLAMVSCNSAPCPDCPEATEVKPTAEQLDFLGITDADHLSAASKRALLWPEESRSNEWFLEYK